MAAILAATALLCACSSHDDDPKAPAREREVVMTLTISDSASPLSSRAPSTPEGGYDRGEGYENYIDIPGGNFRFYFFDENDRFIAPLAVNRVIPVESTSTSKTYVVRCNPMTEKIEQGIKVVALANWPEYPSEDALTPGKTTIADLVKGQYSFSAESMQLSASTTIPLFGVTDLKTLEYNALDYADLGRIHMLRAYAKVEVVLHPESVHIIKSVTLSRYATSGYCAPQQVTAQSQYVHNSYEQDYTSQVWVPSGTQYAENLPFIMVDDHHWIAYVPEFKNTDKQNDDDKAKILIDFGDNDDPGVVYFANYDTSVQPSVPKTHFDIFRNVWYRFTVNKNSAPIVQVVPYNEVDLFPLFGLFVDLELMPIYDDDGLILYWYDRNTGTYYGPDKRTVITNPYITVLYPEGWTIIRDLRDRVIGYYDPEKGQYYDANKNKIDRMNIDASTGWTIIYDEKYNVIGYYDPENNKYYKQDKVTEDPSLADKIK